MSVLGAKTLKRTLEKLLDGTLKRTPQDNEIATYYPMFKKGFVEIDWNMDARRVVDLIRGCNPAPMAYTYIGEEKVKIFKARARDADETINPGDVITCDAKKGLFVKTGKGAVEILQLQFPGGKPMGAKDYLRGKSIKEKHFGKS